ncbi:MAG TPA: hypothetical protein VFB21_14960, partial [Chthonomonadaceae bacterium]|nr:hypothetical protein [Chthonomonadaceae bacterium]
SVCTGEAEGAQCHIEVDDALILLLQLVDKSLVGVEEQGSEARYRLLETTRRYCLMKLTEAGEMETLRARHHDWYRRLAEEAVSPLSGPEASDWRARLEAEQANLREALEWGRASGAGAEAGQPLQEALRHLQENRGR